MRMRAAVLAALLAPLALGGAQALQPAAATASASAPAAAPAPAPAALKPQLLAAHIVHRYPHDPAAFTEGLIWADGALYESVGMEGVSEVRRVRLEDGHVIARVTIPASEFGEGLARWHGQLISLTWHGGVAHRWNERTLKPIGDAHYQGEGWGLASDGVTLLMSDGSSTLQRLDPVTFRVIGHIPVTIAGRPLPDVNELEMVDGALLANVWHTPYLVRIDPASGRVNALVDLRGIVAEVAATDPEAVANGIAWDAAKRRLFITGKRWPTLFEITLRPS